MLLSPLLADRPAPGPLPAQAYIHMYGTERIGCTRADNFCWQEGEKTAQSRQLPSRQLDQTMLNELYSDYKVRRPPPHNSRFAVLFR